MKQPCKHPLKAQRQSVADAPRYQSEKAEAAPTESNEDTGSEAGDSKPEGDDTPPAAPAEDSDETTQ